MFVFIGHQVGPDKGAQSGRRPLAGVDVAARLVQIAAQGHQADQGPADVEVGRTLLHAVAPLQGGRIGPGVESGGPANFPGFQSGPVGRVLGPEGGDHLGQLIEAMAVLLDKRTIDQILFNNR